MPRCFMAKKLKYPYEQWKEEQKRLSDDSSSRSPSPPPPPAQTASMEATVVHDLSVKRQKKGKWCSMSHVSLKTHTYTLLKYWPERQQQKQQKIIDVIS